MRPRRDWMTFQRQAFEVLTSPRLAEALDLSREDVPHPPPLRPGSRLSERARGQDAARPVPAGPAGDRSRGPLRHAGLQPLALRPHAAGRPQLGLAQGPLPRGPRHAAAARPGAVGADPRPGRARPARRDRRGRLGRVRPHAEDQQERRPRPLAEGRQGLLAGGGLRAARSSARRRAGARSREPARSISAKSSPRSISGWGSTSTTQFTDLAGRPQYLVGDHRPLPELIGSA